MYYYKIHLKKHIHTVRHTKILLVHNLILNLIKMKQKIKKIHIIFKCSCMSNNFLKLTLKNK